MTWQLASFLILGLALALGFAWYERSRPPARVLALVAALAALAVVGRLAFAPLPNVKPTTDIVFFAGYALGGAPGFVVGAVTALVSNVFLAHGPWTPWQMAAWGGVGVAGGALGTLVRGRWRLARATEGGTEPRELGRWPLALACGLAGLGFGIVMDVYLWTLAAEQTPASYVALAARSLPFNIAHIVGNVVFCLLIGPPLVRALRRYRRRFEVRWAPVGAPPPGSPAALTVVALSAVLLVALAGPPAAEADRASNQAFRYLLESQNPDGGFGADRGRPSSGTQTGEVALGLAAAGRNPQDVSRNGSSIIDWMRRNIGAVHNVGGVERTILVLRASDLPPRRFAGRNLHAELLDYQGRDGSFGGSLNHAAYGVLALRAAGQGRTSARVQRSADYIEGEQNEDGGFGITGSAPSGTDYTGAALSALAESGRANGAAARRAVAYLDGAQGDSGGFGLTSGARPNAQSTAWSVQGLVATARGGRIVGRALAYLRGIQSSNGSIAYDSSGGSRVWATGQAEAALEREPFPIDPVRRLPERPPASGDSGKGNGDGKAVEAVEDRGRPRDRRPPDGGAGGGPGRGAGPGGGPGSAPGQASPGAGPAAYPIGTSATPFAASPLPLPGLTGAIGGGAGAVGAAGALATPGAAVPALPGLAGGKPKTPGQLLSDTRGVKTKPVATTKPLGPGGEDPGHRIGAGALLVLLVAGGLLLATGGGARARRLWAVARRRTS